MNQCTLAIITSIFICLFSSQIMAFNVTKKWLVIDDFENPATINTWQKKDTQNQTSPHVPNPQVSVLKTHTKINNTFLLKKPAAEGVVGNRKALTFKPLPQTVNVGEIYTFFTRINIEYFPNNHIFGLSNLDANGIEKNAYNALEPSIRITDKFESDGFKNNGTIMVKTDEGYRYIQNYANKRAAKPAKINTWYKIWYVVNNSTIKNGGQKFDVYVQGGEFLNQTLVYQNADFRMKRELPLIYFMMNANTGSLKKPYGNGGVRYDDLYMVKGTLLSSPI